MNMTVGEARACVERVRRGLGEVREAILELYERKGWVALGYASWRECVAAEFGQSQSQLYRELAAAQVELRLSPFGEKPGWLPESHARELAALPEDMQADVYEAAGGDVTAARLRELAGEALRGLPADAVEQLRLVREEEDRIDAEEDAHDREEAAEGERRRVVALADRLRYHVACLRRLHEGMDAGRRAGADAALAAYESAMGLAAPRIPA